MLSCCLVFIYSKFQKKNKLIEDKKVLLRECKRHTTSRIARTCCVGMGGGGVPTLVGGIYPEWGVPTLVGSTYPGLGGTYLGWGYLPWTGEYLPWQGVPWMARR